MYTVYVLHNVQRDKIYIGQTNTLETRIKRHNRELFTKKNSYTNRNKGVWVLVYKEEYLTRNEGLVREKQLKSQKGREFVWNLIKSK